MQFAIETAKIRESLCRLDESGAQELVRLPASQESNVDQEVKALRQEAEKLASRG